MSKTKECRGKKRCLFFPSWESQTPFSSSEAPDPSVLLGDPGLLINLPRNWAPSLLKLKMDPGHSETSQIENTWLVKTQLDFPKLFNIVPEFINFCLCAFTSLLLVFPVKADYQEVCDLWASQLVKSLPATWETWVRALGWEAPLEKAMATHSCILACRILWTV